MAKRTAIIDIGSNSARMAIFERSSRFGFHLIMETKSRVRIGEGAYNFGGLLQDVALERAFKALEEFKNIINNELIILDDKYPVHLSTWSNLGQNINYEYPRNLKVSLDNIVKYSVTDSIDNDWIVKK